jgi:hypothetical protein
MVGDVSMVMVRTETLEMTEADHKARLEAMRQRAETAEENCRSAVEAMRLSMQAQKKAEALAEDRLQGLLAASSFSAMLMRELQRLAEDT